MKSENICIVSFPMPSRLVVNALLTNLIEIFKPICSKLYVITGGLSEDVYNNKDEKAELIDTTITMHLRQTIHPDWWSAILQAVKIIIIQMKICYFLIKISKTIDTVFFFVGGPNLLSSVLVTKILRKKVVVSAIGRSSSGYKMSFHLSLLERIIFYLADRILVESRSVEDFLGLNKYEKKISNEGARYVDVNPLKVKRNLRNMKNVVGYIGRLSLDKGVIDFIKAIPLILKENENVEFLIGGDGPLYSDIKEDLESKNIHNKVKLIGWIPHDELPEYLNELRLIVLPSYSEGLPTIVLEGMACGTPVLATPVGGIPDVIKDGETGFILENNSPECIAKNIIKVLNSSNLDEVANNARKLIEEEYTYEAAVKRYKTMLGDVNDTIKTI